MANPRWEDTQPINTGAPRFEDTLPLDAAPPRFEDTVPADGVAVTASDLGPVAPPSIQPEFTPAQMKLVPDTAPGTGNYKSITTQFTQQREAALRPAAPTDRPVDRPEIPEMRARMPGEGAGVIRPVSSEDMGLIERGARTAASTVGQTVTGAGQMAQMAGRKMQTSRFDLDKTVGKYLELSGQVAAEAGDDFVKKLSYDNPGMYEQVVSGFTSTATFFVPGLGVTKLSKAASLVPAIAEGFGIATSSMMESALEAGMARDEAIKNGLSPEKADAIGRQVFLTNIPITTFGNKLGIFSKSNTMLGKVAKGISGEGLQEGLQTAGANVAMDKRTMADVPESAAIGGLVGGVFGALERRANPLEPQQPPPAPSATPAAAEGVSPKIEAAKLNEVLGQPQPAPISSGGQRPPTPTPAPAAPIIGGPDAERVGEVAPAPVGEKENPPEVAGGPAIPIRRPEAGGMEAPQGAPVAQPPAQEAVPPKYEDTTPVPPAAPAATVQIRLNKDEANTLAKLINNGAGGYSNFASSLFGKIAPVAQNTNNVDEVLNITPEENAIVERIWEEYARSIESSTSEQPAAPAAVEPPAPAPAPAPVAQPAQPTAPQPQQVKIRISPAVGTELSIVMNEIKTDNNLPAAFQSALSKLDAAGSKHFQVTIDEAKVLVEELQNIWEKDKYEPEFKAMALHAKRQADKIIEAISKANMDAAAGQPFANSKSLRGIRNKVNEAIRKFGYAMEYDARNGNNYFRSISPESPSLRESMVVGVGLKDYTPEKWQQELVRLYNDTMTNRGEAPVASLPEVKSFYEDEAPGAKPSGNAAIKTSGTITFKVTPKQQEFLEWAFDNYNEMFDEGSSYLADNPDDKDLAGTFKAENGVATIPNDKRFLDLLDGDLNRYVEIEYDDGGSSAKNAAMAAVRGVKAKIEAAQKQQPPTTPPSSPTALKTPGEPPMSPEPNPQPEGALPAPQPTPEPPPGPKINIDPLKADENGISWAKNAEVMGNLQLYHLVRLSKNITGMVPKIMEFIKIRGSKMSALGRAFVGGPKLGRIELWAEMGDDLTMAKATLAHEIIHIVDAIYGDKSPTLKRGNLLGHIAGFWNYTKSAIKDSVVDWANLTADMERIRKETFAQAFADAKAEGLKGKARSARTKELYRKNIETNLNNAGYFTEEQLRKDLMPAIQWWNGVSGGATHEDAAEMYADAGSMLLNCPHKLAEKAPLFFSLFQTWIKRRPEFIKAYEAMLVELEAPAGSIEEEIERDILEGFLQGDMTSAQRDAYKQKKAEESTTPFFGLFWRPYETSQLALRHGLAIWDSPIPTMDKLAGAASVGRAYLDALRRDIDGILYKDSVLNQSKWVLYLFYNRILNDRSKLFNPRGITPEVATRRLDAMKREIGDENYARLNAMHDKLVAARKEYVFPLLKGFLSDATIAYLEKNDYYVTFHTLNSMMNEDWDGVNSEYSKGIYAQVGTLQDIGNPYSETIKNDLKLIYMALRSNAIKEQVRFAAALEPGSVIPAQRIAKGIFEKPKKEGYVTLYYLDHGVNKAVHMKKGYADPFISNKQEWHPAIIEKIQKFSKVSGINLAKTLYVDANPGFWLWNIGRDSIATSTNIAAYSPLPYVGVLQSLWGTLQNALPAYKHLNGWQINERLSYLMREGIVHSNYERDIGEDIVGPERIYRQYRMGIFKGKMTAREMGMLLFEMWLNIGRASDLANKMGALEFLSRKYPNMSKRELNYMLKNRVGTPNTSMAGVLGPLYNTTLLYSHIAIMGSRASFEAAKQNPLNFGSKVFFNSVFPAAFMALLKSGKFDDDDDEGMRTLSKWAKNISDYDASSYICVPIYPFFDKNGKSIYWRVPKDEFSRLFGGVVYHVGRIAGKEDINLYERIVAIGMSALDYTGGAAPGYSPPLQVLLNNAPDMLRGRVPTNALGQKMMDEELVKMGLFPPTADGGIRLNTEGIKQYLKSVTQLYGLGGYYRMEGATKTEKTKSPLETLVTYPLLMSNIVGRWIKVSDSGLAQPAFEAKSRTQRIEMGESYELRMEMKNYWNDYVRENNSVPSRPEIVRFLNGLRKSNSKAGDKRMKDLLNQFFNNIAAGLDDSRYRVLSSAASNAQKISVLEEIAKTKDPEELARFMREAKMDYFISSGTFKEWRKKKRL